VPSQCFVANKAGIQAGPPRKPRVQYCAKCVLCPLMRNGLQGLRVYPADLDAARTALLSQRLSDGMGA